MSKQIVPLLDEMVVIFSCLSTFSSQLEITGLLQQVNYSNIIMLFFSSTSYETALFTL